MAFRKFEFFMAKNHSRLINQKKWHAGICKYHLEIRYDNTTHFGVVPVNKLRWYMLMGLYETIDINGEH